MLHYLVFSTFVQKAVPTLYVFSDKWVQILIVSMLHMCSITMLLFIDLFLLYTLHM